MPRTGAKGGFRTQVQYKNNSDVWVTIAELKDVNGPAKTNVIEDATNMDSQSGATEYVSTGVIESGEVTTQANLLEFNATHTQLRADLDAGTIRDYRVLRPGAATRVAFQGLVASISPSYQVRGVMVIDITIRPTGPVVEEAHP